MLQNGTVTPIQVTIVLNRLFGGFWAHCPITLQLVADGEVKEHYVVTTDDKGKVTVPLVPHQQNESLNIVVRDTVLHNLALPPDSPSLTVPLTLG